jgi:hypothetical protein
MGIDPIKADARVPEVPNSYVDRHLPWWRAVLYYIAPFVLVMLIIWSISMAGARITPRPPSSSPIPTTTARPGHPSSSPTPTPS